MIYHCMVDAFARVLSISSQGLVDKLSHNGLGTFPNTDIQRTHHVQEILDASISMGCWFAPIELIPQNMDPVSQRLFDVTFTGETISGNFDRFRLYLRDSKGVIVGMRDSRGHAVYWNGYECVDQRGSWKLWGEGSDFSPGVYWKAIWTT